MIHLPPTQLHAQADRQERIDDQERHTPNHDAPPTHALTSGILARSM
jgi:hypothetical protein